MSLQNRDVIVECLRLVLKPIARFCLRHSLKFQEFGEQLKISLLEAAELEIKSSGEKVNISRLSVMTGIHRPDVVRIYRKKSTKTSDSTNALVRVIGRWQADTAYLTPAGRPKTLGFEGTDNEFVALVQGVSTDLNPYAILFEMERVGMVSRTRAGIKLKGEVYNPRGDVRDGFTLLSDDTEDLICSVEENLFSQQTPNHHIKTQYDRIAAPNVEKIRQWLLKEGMAFHEKIRRFLSQHDLDLNPKLSRDLPTTRVAIGSFSRIGPKPVKLHNADDLIEVKKDKRAKPRAPKSK